MLGRRPHVRSIGSVNRDKTLAHERVNVRALAIGLLRKLDSEAFNYSIQRALGDPFMPARREAL